MADRSISVYLRAQISDFKRQMDEAGKSTKKVGEEAKKSSSTATTGLGRLTESAIKNKDSWDKAGKALTAFGTGTIAVLGLSMKAAVDWESAWAGVTKTVDGSDAQLAALEKGLRGLAQTLPASHQEIAAVAEAAGQLGIKTENVLSFTKTMIDLGETTNLSAEEAATAIARFTNVMGTSQTNVDRLGSVIVGLGNNFATTEAEIVAMGQRLSAAGAIAGFTEPQVLGLATAMSSIGIEAEAGGSAMSQVIQAISKAVASGGEDVEAFANLAGMSAQNFALAWKRDPITALDAVVTGLASMNASGANSYAVLEDLGLSGIRQTAVLQGLATATGLTTKAVTMASEAWDENTALVDEANKRYETAEAKIQIAKNSINDAAISLGETFLPIVASSAEKIASLAQWFGALPAPVQQAAGGLGALAGTVALVAGGFLLTFPRIIETVQAFRKLSAISPTVASGLGKVSKAAGIVGSAIAAMTASSGIPKWGVNTMEGAGVAAQALLDVASGAQTANDAFSGLFNSGSFREWFTGNDVDSIETAFAILKDSSVSQNVDNIASSLLTFGQTTSTNRLQAEELFRTIDQGLSSLVQSGAADQAAAALAEIGIELEGNEDLLSLYNDALANVDVQQRLTGESASGAAGGLSDLEQATAEADSAMQDWLDTAAEADASFVGLGSAYNNVVQKNKEVAQSTAAATKSSKDSWEDYYDGVSISVDQYLDELQRQVDAQTEWETNMLLLSGRVSQGVLDGLIEMGADGAVVVAGLVDATDEELARLEELYGERSTNATNNWANNINRARNEGVIAEAAAQLGEDAAREIAAKLSDGVTTVEDIVREYGLVLKSNPLQVPLDTELTLQQLSGLLGEISSSSGTITMMGDTGPAGQSLEDVTALIDQSAGTVTIYGADGEAITTLASFTSMVDAATGAVKIQGTDAEGRATVATLTDWVGQQGNSISVDANTTQAMQAINALIVSQAGRVITLATALGGAAGGSVGAIAGFAGGGRVPGASPADPMVDNLLASVDGSRTIAVRSGEFIQSQPAVDHYGLGTMYALNARRIPKDVLQGYAVGGAPGDTGRSVGSYGYAPSPIIQATGGITADEIRDAFDGMSMTLVTEAGPIRAIARTEALSVATAQRGSRPRS